MVEGVAGCAALEGSVRSGVLAPGAAVPLPPARHGRARGARTTSSTPPFADLADFDASFVVDSFHSYAHGDDGVWRPVRDFSLTGAAADAGVGSPT